MGGLAQGQHPGRGGEQPHDGSRVDGVGDVLDVVGHGFNRIVEPSVETFARYLGGHEAKPSNSRTTPAHRSGPPARIVDAGRQELRGGGDPPGRRAHRARLPHLCAAARARSCGVPRAGPRSWARDRDIDHAGGEPRRSGGGVPHRRREPRPAPGGPADAASGREGPPRSGARRRAPTRRRVEPRRDVRGTAGGKAGDQTRHAAEVGACRARDPEPRPANRLPGVRGHRCTGRRTGPPAQARRLPP